MTAAIAIMFNLNFKVFKPGATIGQRQENPSQVQVKLQHPRSNIRMIFIFYIDVNVDIL